VNAAPNRRHNPFPVGAGFETIYAHAVEVAAGRRTLHVSGQIGVAPDGSIAADFAAQFEQAINNLSAVLGAADMALADIVKLTFFVTRPDHLAELGEIRRRRLAVAPAVTTLVVAGLASPALLVEVEAIAARAP
jgi:enamine deaminase RidA (YjgF/YER057c/UK114 family)